MEENLAGECEFGEAGRSADWYRLRYVLALRRVLEAMARTDGSPAASAAVRTVRAALSGVLRGEDGGAR